ncbi:MAG: hypothetical protein NTZ32_21705 [Planctomycetales bacterium]|nr:hypothetical protein [Planctomycetales bacterium]
MMPRTAMNEIFEGNRASSGHEFPATMNNPQPDGKRLANLSTWAAWGICVTEAASRKPTRPESLHSRLRLGR